MKKTKKFLGSIATAAILLNKTVYAASEVAEESEGFPSKYVFMGVALLVIVLLLFLGYRMDSKDEGMPSYKAPKKDKKNKSSKKQPKEDIAYTEDKNVTYETDKYIDTNDLNDEIEYDEEESLFDIDSNDSEPKLYDDSFTDTTYTDTSYEEDNLYNNTEDETEEYGEIFDTSIIDGIDDEDEISNTEDKEPETSMETSNTFDETMIFNNLDNTTSTNLEDEINNLEEEKDPFIEELKNFKEPETTFAGFSVGDDSNKVEHSKEKSSKKYTKNKKEDSDTNVEEDFLLQMEANLQNGKDSEEPKTTTKKSTTRKKKE